MGTFEDFGGIKETPEQPILSAGDQNMADWAKWYVSQGLSVVPVAPGAKSPSVPWRQFSSNRPTSANIDYWWSGLDRGRGIGSRSTIYRWVKDGRFPPPSQSRLVPPPSPGNGATLRTGSGLASAYPLSHEHDCEHEHPTPQSCTFKLGLAAFVCRENSLGEHPEYQFGSRDPNRL